MIMISYPDKLCDTGKYIIGVAFILLFITENQVYSFILSGLFTEVMKNAFITHVVMSVNSVHVFLSLVKT